MKPIWIVNDDQSIRRVLEKALARESSFSRNFTSVHDALNALDEETPQVPTSGVHMPGGSGLDLLQATKTGHPGLPVIIMAVYPNLDSAIAAFQGGVFEYFAEPFDMDRAVELIRRMLEESLHGEEIDDCLSDVPEILGQAPAMQDVFRVIGRLSQSNVTVLITGESGTGKELVVRASHKHNPHASGPFIALNTAAIPKDLLESELFGHECGAFTGVRTVRHNCFEQAEGGALFLSEVDDISSGLQARLLHVLSDGHFYRMGGHNSLEANVRIIAATHQNLEIRVRDGLSREDLFRRLNVARLRLSALHERLEGVMLLARHFLQKSVKELGAEPKHTSGDALAHVTTLSPPGNVWQLENLYNWLAVMAPAQTIESKDSPTDLVRGNAQMLPVMGEAAARPTSIGEPLHGDEPYGATPSVDTLLPSSAAGVSIAAGWERALAGEAKAMLEAGQPNAMDTPTRRFEEATLEVVLGITCGRRVEAATRLGIGRNTTTRKLQEFGFGRHAANGANPLDIVEFGNWDWADSRQGNPSFFWWSGICAVLSTACV